MLTVALIGRPNVGKSTLFNRLTGRRHALVHDLPGVTRDWREGQGHLGPLELRVLDTAGLGEAKEGSLEARMRNQTLQAIDEAQVALLVLDGREGITPFDRDAAQLLRKSGKPTVVTINKCEGGAGAAVVAEAWELGLGEPLPISAEHGDGMGMLCQLLLPFEPEDDEDDPFDLESEDEDAPPPVMQLAIIGRPNAGKSTLINRILGHERVLTGPEAGITRDSIAIDYEYDGKPLKLVDTAGMRRRSKVDGSLEKLAVGDTLRAVRYAHVVIVVMDAQTALEKQDNAIVDLVESEGRAVVIAINKWDLVDDKKAFTKAAEERIAEVLPQVRGVAIVPISAKDGNGIGTLFKKAFEAYARWNTRLGTAELNRWLEGALTHHSPPLVDGRRLKIKFISQTRMRPPTFTLSCNLAEMPDHYQRYLAQDLRKSFDLPGVPLRFKIKTSKNPYKKDK